MSDWNEYEEKFLRENYTKLTNKELALKLNRSVRSIEHKVVRMNLKKREVIPYIEDLEDEIWKKIGTTVYSISQFGRCKNDNTNRIMIPRMDRYGYLKVKLIVGDSQKDFTIHRLVAEAFLPKVEGKNYINHIDGIKNHSYLSNLEWCTASENSIHAHKNHLTHPKKGIEVYGAKFTDDVIESICKLASKGYKAKKIIEILKLDINFNYVNALIRGESRKDITHKYINNVQRLSRKGVDLK